MLGRQVGGGAMKTFPESTFPSRFQTLAAHEHPSRGAATFDPDDPSTMPTIQQNIDNWGRNYDWSEHGDEWSSPWGTTAALWWGMLFPRICSSLPARTILEIAPGHGRCTQYLIGLCQQLVVVDLNKSCIQACKQRFSQNHSITYHINDGKSLDMIPDGSIDFAFSYDSLVHVDSSTMEAYAHGLGRVLAPDGLGFLHHSNFGASIDPATGEHPAENPHWRDEGMTAAKFVDFCEAAGLECLSQELIQWGDAVDSDAFSRFTRVGSRFSARYQCWHNEGFAASARQTADLARVYGMADDGVISFHAHSAGGTSSRGRASDGLAGRALSAIFRLLPGRGR